MRLFQGCLGLIGEGGGINDSKGDGAVELLGLLAGDGVVDVVAAQDGLVEHGLVAADERPLEGLHNGTELILSRPADMEHLCECHYASRFSDKHYTTVHVC